MFDYNWYLTLNKPAFTPPAWIFSPVWTVLYLSMLVALILFAKEKTNRSKTWGYVLFFGQILMNLIWTPTFFGLKNVGLALALIVLLDILVLINIIEFSKTSKASGYILIPYFLWILFATYLNFGYFVLN